MEVPQNFERTFIMIKPDGVQRGLIGKIIQRFEKKGVKLAALKYMQASEELVKLTYVKEKDEPYFGLLMKIMTAGPVVPMVWEGVDAVGIGRRLVSELVTSESVPGTIRGNCCLHVGRNVVHGADSLEEAHYDISIWFPNLV